jgi:hypothetical protein
VKTILLRTIVAIFLYLLSFPSCKKKKYDDSTNLFTYNPNLGYLYVKESSGTTMYQLPTKDSPSIEHLPAGTRLELVEVTDEDANYPRKRRTLGKSTI